MTAIERTVARSLVVVSVVVIGLGAALAVTATAQQTAVVVRDAWVRPPAASKDETALYMTIENTSADKRAVVSVMCDVAKVAEMHKMSMDGKLMKMTQIAQIDVPAKGKASLKPNSMHVMLVGMKARPAVGDSLDGTLKLDDGTMVPFKAEVRK
jgi:copper(I)-binding protein